MIKFNLLTTQKALIFSGLLFSPMVHAETHCACLPQMNCCYVDLVIDSGINVTTLDQPANMYGLETVCGMPASSTTLKDTYQLILVPLPGPPNEIGGIQLTFANSTPGGPTPNLNLQVESGSGKCITQGTIPTTFTPDPLYYQAALLSCDDPEGNKATCTIKAVQHEPVFP